MERQKIMEDVACNLCGSDNYKVLHKARYNKVMGEEELIAKFRSSGDETLIDQVVKCRKCGLIYINPRINPDLIIKGYSEGEDPTFVSQAKGRELTFARCLKQIEKLKRNGKILDVGTAGGSFLAVAKRKGWDVYGCEPNKWLCNWAKENYGIDVRQGDIFRQKYESNFFDVVTLWDVLEHTPDPMAALKECSRILKPGGLLVVNYPDIGSSIARIMRSKWIFLLSVHLYYFTPKTIRKALNKSGFSVLKIKPHFQSLALGYLVFRMKAYSKLLHNIGNMVVRLTRTQNLQIPYWLGQTLVIARKR